MVASLPRGSRALALLDRRTEWTDEAYLLADIADSLHALMYGLAGGRKGGGPRPKPIQRPGDEPKRKHASMPASDIKGYFDGLGAKNVG